MQNENEKIKSTGKKRKWPTILKLIFKWIGLALLALLLIAAIIFRAPWKIITLLAIILLACTALPKTLRKWFWAGVALIVIALIIWVFLPVDNEGWKSYTFDKELAAIEAKRAIPDKENAAIIYNQLLETYDDGDLEPNLPDPNFYAYDMALQEPWSGEDYPELAKWLKERQTIIATLLEASQKEKCRFPIVADTAALGQHMNIFSPMRSWAYLLRYAANNDLAEGRPDHAVEKQIALLQMANHLCQQTTTLFLLTGIAIEDLALENMNSFIVQGQPASEHLGLIENKYAEIKHNWKSDLPGILEGEKLLMKSLLAMFYETNPNGKTRLSRNPTAALRALSPQIPQEIPPLTYWQRKLVKAGTILGWFFLPSTPEKAGKIIDHSYEKLYEMAEPDFGWQKEPKGFSITSIRFNFRFLTRSLVDMSYPVHYGLHDIYLRCTADKRGSRILIALRRYKNKQGHWPESLEDIKPLADDKIFTDPLNGSSFVYKLTNENFILYSIGKNNIDDDGRRDRWNKEKTGADDWLIWPKK